MNKKSMTIIGSTLILAVFISSACFLAPQPPPERLDPAPESKEKVEEVIVQRAINTIDASYFVNPKNKDREENSVSTAEDLKQVADRAFEQGNYTLSKGMYEVLLKNFSDFEGLDEKPSFTRREIELGLKNSKAKVAGPLYQRNKRIGEYGKALGIYLRLLNEYPGDPALTAALSEAGHEFKAIGDKALADKNFGLAGKALSPLLSNYTAFSDIRPPVSFTREALEKSLEDCRAGLTKRGLVEYRKGDLTKAITIWEGLLAFDPQNAEVRKAVETARDQASKLKKKAA
jgi:tetratricopeptide (TPR) repeat protein